MSPVTWTWACPASPPSPRSAGPRVRPGLPAGPRVSSWGQEGRAPSPPWVPCAVRVRQAPPRRVWPEPARSSGAPHACVCVLPPRCRCYPLLLAGLFTPQHPPRQRVQSPSSVGAGRALVPPCVFRPPWQAPGPGGRCARAGQCRCGTAGSQVGTRAGGEGCAVGAGPAPGTRRSGCPRGRSR